MPVRRDGERVPADEYRRGPLAFPEPRHHVREADDGVEAHRFRNTVVRAVREGVAVDREQFESSIHDEYGAVRTRWAARCGVLGRADRSTIGAPCVLVSHSPITPGHETSS